jgi:hypothetical protein
VAHCPLPPLKSLLLPKFPSSSPLSPFSDREAQGTNHLAKAFHVSTDAKAFRLQAEKPEAWIGPWKKDIEGRWKPNWGGGMDPEYRSMRDVLQRNLMRDEGRGSDSGGLLASRPPWKVPGRSSAALTDLFRVSEPYLDPAGGLPRRNPSKLSIFSLVMHVVLIHMFRYP